MSELWAIQNNLGSNDESTRLINACKNNNIEVVGIKVIPFSHELPEITTDIPVIFYGSTGFTTRIHESKAWVPGVWYEEDIFRKLALRDNRRGDSDAVVRHR